MPIARKRALLTGSSGSDSSPRTRIDDERLYRPIAVRGIAELVATKPAFSSNRLLDPVSIRHCSFRGWPQALLSNLCN